MSSTPLSHLAQRLPVLAVKSNTAPVRSARRQSSAGTLDSGATCTARLNLNHLAIAIAVGVVTALSSSLALAANVQLRIMQTTDLHMHAMNFDYYQNKEVDDFGLARTATLIRDARREARNSLLFDNGDLIQGNPMGDYMARSRGLSYGEVHPIYKAMNLLRYDAANIGNHEFNYVCGVSAQVFERCQFPLRAIECV